jgi:hypothetical protein
MNPTSRKQEEGKDIDWLYSFLKPYTQRTDENSRKIVDLTMEIVKDIVNTRYSNLSQQEKDYTISRFYKIVVRGC